MAFPYDEANTVMGLVERMKKKSNWKDKSTFREKHNEYNEKSTKKCAKFSTFLYIVMVVSFVFTFFD